MQGFNRPTNKIRRQGIGAAPPTGRESKRSIRCPERDFAMALWFPPSPPSPPIQSFLPAEPAHWVHSGLLHRGHYARGLFYLL